VDGSWKLLAASLTPQASIQLQLWCAQRAQAQALPGAAVGAGAPRVRNKCLGLNSGGELLSAPPEAGLAWTLHLKHLGAAHCKKFISSTNRN